MANECFRALSVCYNYISFPITGLANATAILEESYQEYPSSAVFLFFKGLVSRLKVCFDLRVLPEFWRGKGKRENIVFSAHGLIPPFFPYLTPVHLIWGNPRQSWILDCTMWIPDSRFQLLDSSLIQWNLDSGFQSLVGFQIHWDAFWIPKHRILDSTSENFPDSRIWIPLHGVNLPWRVERDISEIVFQWWIQGSPPLIFFYQTEVRRPEKIFLETAPPPPLI